MHLLNITGSTYTKHALTSFSRRQETSYGCRVEAKQVEESGASHTSVHADITGLSHVALDPEEPEAASQILSYSSYFFFL